MIAVFKLRWEQKKIGTSAVLNVTVAVVPAGIAMA